jgi:hypothetical protein
MRPTPVEAGGINCLDYEKFLPSMSILKFKLSSLKP